MPRGLESSVAASATVGLAPALDIPVINTLGPLGKVAIGGALFWFTMNQNGAAMAVGYGIGIGLVVDGLLDLTLGQVVPQNVSA
jgi:hypothetical protein